MFKRPLLSTIGVLVLLVAGSAPAEIGPAPPEPDRLWFMLCVQSPIANGRDYDQALRFLVPPEKVGEPMPAFQLEIRDAKTQKPVLSFEFAPFGAQPNVARMGTSSNGVPDAQRGRLADLPEGEYRVAVTQSGERCSNVARFEIRREFQSAELPVLEAIPLEAPPYRELPFLGLRMAGSQGFSEPVRYSEACYAELTIDGVARRWTMTVWGGLDPELRRGDRWVAIIDPAGMLAPPVGAGKEHQVEVRVGPYRAGPIGFNAGSPDGDAWDSAAQPG